MSSSFWKGKKVLVTGANGFLGSHLTKALVDRGNNPCVLIYKNNKDSIFESEKLHKYCVVLRGDIRNFKLIASIFNKYKFDTVFHLAAQAIVDSAMDRTLETLETNISGTFNILEASRKTDEIKRIIVASSDKAYGHHDNLPYSEDNHCLKGVYPYEVSKTCADLIAQSYAKTFNLPICITRCVNMYGPGDLNWNRIVPQNIYRFFKNKPPIVRDSGKSVRDYLYIEDAVLAYLSLAEKMNEKFIGQAFNFATNTPITVLEVFNAMAKAFGKNIKPVLVKTHGFEIKRQYSSFDKIEKMVGWRPTHTFSQGISKTISWYSAYLEKKSPKNVV